MAIFLQQASPKLTVDAGVSGGVSFSATPAAGSTVLVMLGSYNNTSRSALSVTDNQGNTYVLDKEKATGFAGSVTWASIWRASNVASSGTFTVTITLDNATGYLSAACLEVRGVKKTSPLDQTSSANDGGTAGTTAAPGSVTTTTTHQYVVPVLAWNVSNAGFTAPAGYITRVTEFDGITHQGMNGRDKILTAAGSENPTWTLNVADYWAVVIATYKAEPALMPVKSSIHPALLTR